MGQCQQQKRLADQNLYDALVDAFSMRSFVPSAGVSGHDHFFDTFGKIWRHESVTSTPGNGSTKSPRAPLRRTSNTWN